jgi:hypothetical protein
MPPDNPTYEQHATVAEETEAPSAHRAHEAEAIASWRLSYALSLGFSPEKAKELTAAAIDLHEVEALTFKGCPPELALAILL